MPRRYLPEEVSPMKSEDMMRDLAKLPGEHQKGRGKQVERTPTPT